MTDAEKIAALAAELTRIGKMPEAIMEWVEFATQSPRRDDSKQHLAIALAALLGVAASEVLPNHGYMIVRSGKTDIGEADEEGNIIWADWCWELYKHCWGNGDDYLGQFDSCTEAILAALKQIESEVENE
jgi:hypothetical protein